MVKHVEQFFKKISTLMKNAFLNNSQLSLEKCADIKEEILV